MGEWEGECLQPTGDEMNVGDHRTWTSAAAQASAASAREMAWEQLGPFRGLVFGGTEVGRKWLQDSVWGASCERTRLVAKG